MKETIRYYAKENALGETSYFATWEATRERSNDVTHFAHMGAPEIAVKALLHNHPSAKLINGPPPEWDKMPHSDGFGEFSLRPLTPSEEKRVCAALKGC